MNDATSTGFGVPLTAESLINLVNKFVPADHPILVRVSPTAMQALRDLPQPPFFGHPGFAHISVTGLPVDLDLELTGFQAEVDYLSGKIEKLNLDPKAKV